MAPRILCVAEKPAIAKAVAQHLSGGSMETVPVRGNRYVKNYQFDFDFGAPWGRCEVTMTSVLGHLTRLDFDNQHRGWDSCQPGSLFEAPAYAFVDADKEAIARNIQARARGSRILFIWTDCDREGEHIGTEVRYQAKKVNARIEVKRAKFSNTERAHVLQAARAPIELDEFQANAVAARIELDLRIGAAFTRLQCLRLRDIAELLAEKIISYGSCQFPTLGFVVDRYLRVRNFKPENFWSIKVIHHRDGVKVNFNWRRVHLFDRAAVTVMLERCLSAGKARVARVNQKPTSKWRPLPLTTVDLQMMGSRYLRMSSRNIMEVAESLYTKGFISYPRTETDQFDKAIDLKNLVEKQLPDRSWGQYAQGCSAFSILIAFAFPVNTADYILATSLLNGNFRIPRSGRRNDRAHPPIHPVCWVSPNQLTAGEKGVYEFVTRRFLACCSENAKGQTTEIDLQYGDESFNARGLMVLERNYLDVYIYDKWESSQQLPRFQAGELFEPTEANIVDGKTTAPNYLTEPELIGLMDANGIGTDATMAEHIAKIKDREYVGTRYRSGGRNGVQELIPTSLGIALVEGYDDVVTGIPDSPSLSKPFLRKEMESRMRDICAGTKTKSEVVQESLDKYHDVFIHTQRRIHLLRRACLKYVVNGGVS